MAAPWDAAVIGGKGSRIGATGLVAMNAVTHVNDRGHGLEIEGRRSDGITEKGVLLLDRCNIFLVFRRRDGKEQEVALFMASRIGFYADAIRA